MNFCYNRKNYIWGEKIMRKSIFIAVILFLASSVLQLLLNSIINEQIIARILYGVDYHTYHMNYYSGTVGFLGLISESKMPYEWIFSLSKFIIAIACVMTTFLIIKKLKVKYTVTKKEFIMIMSLFSILSLYHVIIYIIKLYSIPPIKLFKLPVLFIVSVYIGIYKMLYQKCNKDNI